jgi:hypothetical protein
LALDRGYKLYQAGRGYEIATQPVAVWRLLDDIELIANFEREVGRTRCWEREGRNGEGDAGERLPGH